MTATKSLLGQVRIDMNDLHTTVELLASTNEEMQRQEWLWGEQNHPLIGECSVVETLRWSYRCQAEEWKRTNDARSDLGEDGWDGILLEEVYEALSEDDAERAVEELIQVAAVALSAAKSIMRHGLGGKRE